MEFHFQQMGIIKEEFAFNENGDWYSVFNSCTEELEEREKKF